ncbi:transmembrane 9 family protein [Megamonas hypermegale]|uniref:transmembrane 9 family protein n=2 Tax=Megamonas hypermegale TaxID=158847 RepID=UPI00117CF1D1|nr:transmembrane 9 family protein [Megamonas hypermegale]
MVEPTKKVSWFPLILLSFITGGSWLIIYAIYYFIFKSSECPMCGAKNLKKR